MADLESPMSGKQLRILMTELVREEPGGPVFLEPVVLDLAASKELFVLFGLLAHGELTEACFEAESEEAQLALRGMLSRGGQANADIDAAARASLVFRTGHDLLRPTPGANLFVNSTPREDLFAPTVSLANYMAEFPNVSREIAHSSAERIMRPKPPPPVFLMQTIERNDLALASVLADEGEGVVRARVERIYSVGKGLVADPVSQEISFVGAGGVWGMDALLEPGDRAFVFLRSISGRLYEDSHLRVEESAGVIQVIIQLRREWLPEPLRSAASEATRNGWEGYCALPFAVAENYLEQLIAKVGRRP